MEELFEIYKALIQALHLAGIQLKASKVEFGRTECTFHNGMPVATTIGSEIAAGHCTQVGRVPASSAGHSRLEHVQTYYGRFICGPNEGATSAAPDYNFR